MRNLLSAALILVCSGCALEVHLGPDQGIPAIAGSATLSLENFVCGHPIAFEGGEMTTTKIADGCALAFDREIEVLSEKDYAQLSQLKGAGELLTSVQLDVRKLDLIDADTLQKQELRTLLRAAALTVNGQAVADRDSLAALPVQISLAEQALEPIKRQVEAQVPATVRVILTVNLPDSPKPPRQLRVDFEAQPSFVLAL